LAKYSEWNESAILDRREKIIEWAKDRWNVTPPTPIEPEPDDEAPVWVRARGNHVYEQLKELHELITAHKLFYIYFYKNSISYASKYNAIWKALTIWPYNEHLWIKIRPWWWTKYPNMTQEIMEEIFGSKWDWWLHKDKLPEFYSLLENAFDVIRGE